MTRWIDAVFVRGGTSKGLCFTAGDLPGGLELPGVPAGQDSGTEPRAAAEPGLGSGSGSGSGSGESVISGEEDRAARMHAFAERDAILCAALGSPDPYGRQLDGMGGGISSLSKALIVDRSERDGVDLDYTFAQIAVDEATVDYSGNCGNLSSAVVPFALAAGLIESDDGRREFTLFNTNTAGKVIVRLEVLNGQAAVSGQLELPGVAGQGSAIELVYPGSGGSRTAGVLPTGNPIDVLAVPVAGETREVRVSLVDAAIPLVLVRAADFGLTGAESPEELDALTETMALLEAVRREGAVRMGLCETPQTAPQAVPKITLVARPAQSRLLDGSILPADAADVLVRAISMRQAHRAVPGTGAMCLAAAAAIGGPMLLPTLVAEIVGEAREARAACAATGGDDDSSGSGSGSGSVRLATPSGVVVAAAVVASTRAALPELNRPLVIETSLARTARVLMRGQVAIP